MHHILSCKKEKSRGFLIGFFSKIQDLGHVCNLHEIYSTAIRFLITAIRQEFHFEDILLAGDAARQLEVCWSRKIKNEMKWFFQSQIL